VLGGNNCIPVAVQPDNFSSTNLSKRSLEIKELLQVVNNTLTLELPLSNSAMVSNIVSASL